MQIINLSNKKYRAINVCWITQIDNLFDQNQSKVAFIVDWREPMK